MIRIMDKKTELTISEIARHWRKNRVSVRRAMDSRRIPLLGRKIDFNGVFEGLWLIRLDSVVRRWGAPTVPLDEE